MILLSFAKKTDKSAKKILTEKKSANPAGDPTDDSADDSAAGAAGAATGAAEGKTKNPAEKKTS